MAKKKYYVSVQAKTVMENQGDAAYELEIEATPEEVNLLFELFESVHEIDLINNSRVTYNPEVLDREMAIIDPYDEYMTDIYRMLHKLGTPATKRHIESMNVLQGMQNGYHDEF